ncbi:MAG: M23 family metallopeptidase [Bacteriovorax sp.]
MRSNYELVQNEIVPKIFEGRVVGDLYDSVLKDTQNEVWAKTLAEAFKDDLVSIKGLKVPANYYFKTETEIQEDDNDKASDRIAYARLIVGSALVEKELRLDPTTNLETLVNKLPELEDRQFLSPVKAERISSQFNLARRHPVKRRRIQPHNGVDFTAKSSTPVYPALEGVVIAMGRARAKGKFILIEHDNGMKSTYDHLRKFQKGLRIGDYVEVGDQIGEVGRTGYATGSHLHFGLLNEDGLYVNPILYLKDYQVETDDGHGPDSGSLDEFDEAPGLEAEY